MLRDRGYAGTLLLAALFGIPVSLAAFGFTALEHALQKQLWTHLPTALGYTRPPWWWPLPLLAVAGVLVGLCVTRLPGRGGHVPAEGLAGGPTPPSALPGALLAAVTGLPLGVILGPEAPLMALGSGLALLTVRRARRREAPGTAAMLGAAGSCAAISSIFGSPLVAAVLIIESAGLGGPQLIALVLPCLLASGVGALVFTGFGHWTGLATGALSLPSVPPAGIPDAADFLWGMPLAVLIGCGVTAAMALGRRVADWTGRHTLPRTAACAVAVGVCVSAYALTSGRSPAEAALSGQSAMAGLAADPRAWPVSALLLLVLFKGLGWSICLGSLRGGPIFPSLLLGAAAGVACAGLPGLGPAPALAVGLAAAVTACVRLPVSAVLLTALLLGRDSAGLMPLAIVAGVLSLVTRALLDSRAPAAGTRSPAYAEKGRGLRWHRTEPGLSREENR
jgi:H+/Cl- antiporter ClcA